MNLLILPVTWFRDLVYLQILSCHQNYVTQRTYRAQPLVYEWWSSWSASSIINPQSMNLPKRKSDWLCKVSSCIHHSGKRKFLSLQKFWSTNVIINDITVAAESFWTPIFFPLNPIVNKSCKSECCCNKMHQIVQNMIQTRGLELKLSLLWRTNISGQHPLV